MSENDRRRAPRSEEAFSVSVVTPHAIEITGETVNFSRGGVLLRAHGRISVILGLKGKRYRGWLVRAVPRDSETTDYAIELEEVIELDTDHAASSSGEALPGSH